MKAQLLDYGSDGAEMSSIAFWHDMYFLSGHPIELNNEIVPMFILSAVGTCTERQPSTLYLHRLFIGP
jgi:hypothetical protein